MASFSIPTTPAEVKRALTDVSAICKELGLLNGARTQQQGLLVLCPWHAETNPSCSITLGTDGTVRVKCFACKATGDVLTLIAQVKGLDATKQFGAVLAEGRRVAACATTTDILAGGSTSDTDETGGSDAEARTEARARISQAFLERCPLKPAPDVQGYLSERRLLDAAAAEGWGALPASWDKSVQIINQIIVTQGLEVWEKSGFASTIGGLAWPEHRLLIPWRDPSGRVITLQRRLVRPAEGDEQKYVFPRRGAPTWPYGVEVAVRNDKPRDIVFVEGASDVLALRALYEKHAVPRVVVGVPGVANFQRSWAELAKGRTAYVAFDRDEAGDRAAEQVAAKLYASGASRVIRIRPARGKDWAEIMMEVAS